MNLLLVPERPYYLCFLPCYYTCFARLDNHQAPHREVKSKCVHTHTHTHTHTYMATAFMCPSWWSSQGESFQNWSMKAEMESGEHLNPQNFLGSVFNDVWGLMEPINSALGFFFFFFLCCLKPDDMHSGATWLSELVVEYKVSFVQQGEETL